uniref:Uncharacterized protein n=1 Tax=Glossina brevipalpis TaxID=37001 RepID=A0A1A9WUQ6_9MUSC
MRSVKRKQSKALAAALTAQRVFLYMQPQTASYPMPEDENTYMEIELEHRNCVITQLRDHYTPENKIHLKSFETEKPTFSITIEQDSYDVIEAFGDAPLTLTLYEHYIPELSLSEDTTIQLSHRKMEERWPLAQGHIDMMQFFVKWRCKKTVDKVEDRLLDDCDGLVATISWQSKELTEFTSKYHKVFICKYTDFTRQLVCDNTTYCKWEMLIPQDSEFNFPNIKANVDYNLVCNSMHRYVLTDRMHRQLEKDVVNDKLHLKVEIFRESNPTMTLLQGFIDLSIFLYPNVNNCSFAVKMTPPSNYSVPESVTKRKSSIDTTRSDISPTFAIIKICVKTPITEPPRDFFATGVTDSVYSDCWDTRGAKASLGGNDEKYKKIYREFDNTIHDLIEYIVTNNLYNTKDKNYFCGQVCNVANRVLPLLAFDFNTRFPTETNIEFVNLMTTVYKELVKRVHPFLMKDTDVNTPYTDVQENIISRINLAKLMYELENVDMCHYLFDQLQKDYGRNSLFRFYKFIFDIELGEYNSAREYLNLPYAEKDLKGELFTGIIKIYINYMEDLNSEELTANEKLLIALNDFCENMQPKSQIGWILLFCLYKKHKYRPGMEYSRWKYDHLFRDTMPTIEYIPTSRWNIFNNFTPNLTSIKAQYFWKAIEVLIDIGLYRFAAWIFDEIADECSDIEEYIIKTSFKFHLRQSDQLKEAEDCFIQATSYGMYFPDVWAYLALINLKLGEYLKALECWKYARLNPNILICGEISKELVKVDCDRIDILEN